MPFIPTAEPARPVNWKIETILAIVLRFLVGLMIWLMIRLMIRLIGSCQFAVDSLQLTVGFRFGLRHCEERSNPEMK